jgi:nicotinate-nucleotide adenylyltransferase
MSAMERLGVMGGTFDPLHIGHLTAASEARHAFHLDMVLFVPTGHPWQKQDFSDPEDRWIMTMLGARTDPHFAASRMEIDRRRLTYTVDTLAELDRFYDGAVALYFIAGADAVLNLDTWQGLDRLPGLAQIIVVNRPGFDLDALKPGPKWPDVSRVEIPGVHISSTELRKRVRTGRPIEHLVPADVATYIRDQGLYAGDREARGD